VSLTLDLPADLQTRLEEKARRDGVNPSDAALNALRQGLSENLSLATLSEAEIMQRIHAQGDDFTPEFWRRYQELLAHVRNETMTEERREEFIPYNDRVELANAERLRYLAELARRYNLSLSEVIGRFGVGPLTLPETK
jgi:hypothetical protein